MQSVTLLGANRDYREIALTAGGVRLPFEPWLPLERSRSSTEKVDFFWQSCEGLVDWPEDGCAELSVEEFWAWHCRDRAALVFLVRLVSENDLAEDAPWRLALKKLSDYRPIAESRGHQHGLSIHLCVIIEEGLAGMNNGCITAIEALVQCFPNAPLWLVAHEIKTRDEMPLYPSQVWGLYLQSLLLRLASHEKRYNSYKPEAGESYEWHPLVVAARQVDERHSFVRSQALKNLAEACANRSADDSGSMRDEAQAEGGGLPTSNSKKSEKKQMETGRPDAMSRSKMNVLADFWKTIRRVVHDQEARTVGFIGDALAARSRVWKEGYNQSKTRRSSRWSALTESFVALRQARMPSDAKLATVELDQYIRCLDDYLRTNRSFYDECDRIESAFESIKPAARWLSPREAWFIALSVALTVGFITGGASYVLSAGSYLALVVSALGSAAGSMAGVLVINAARRKRFFKILEELRYESESVLQRRGEQVRDKLRELFELSRSVDFAAERVQWRNLLLRADFLARVVKGFSQRVEEEKQSDVESKPTETSLGLIHWCEAEQVNRSQSENKDKLSKWRERIFGRENVTAIELEEVLHEMLHREVSNIVDGQVPPPGSLTVALPDALPNDTTWTYSNAVEGEEGDIYGALPWPILALGWRENVRPWKEALSSE